MVKATKPYVDGDPIAVSFFIMSRNDAGYEKEFDSTITDNWRWDFDEQTPYGLAHIHCQ